MKKLNLLLLGILCLCGGRAIGQFKAILTFDSVNGRLGAYSQPLIIGNQIYATAFYGGAKDSGTLFTIDTAGNNYVDLHDFTEKVGSRPVGMLVTAGGKLYGVTEEGGKYDSGCIYSIQMDGAGYKDMYDFTGPSGREPIGSMVFSGGRLFGATLIGGQSYKGVIFSIDTDGTGYIKMHDFGGVNDGVEPLSSLTLSGNVLYGVTALGGLHDSGTVFSIHTNGALYTDLFNFTGPNGLEPTGGVAVSGKSIYGTTFIGGASHRGCIFSVDTDGTNYLDMHDFSLATGEATYGPITLKGDMLFGSCVGGGAKDSGCIFSILTDGGSYRDLYDMNYQGFGCEFDGFTIKNQTIYGVTVLGGAKKKGVVFSYTNSLLGVNNVTVSTGNILVYPNPNNGQFNVICHSEQSEESLPTIQVYNMIGEQVLTETLQSAQGDNLINLSNQPNGIYLYKVISEDGTMAGEGKLVIQK